MNIEFIDYKARTAIILLNEFPGVATYECCTGHLQERISLKKAVRYIPGLEVVQDKWLWNNSPIAREQAIQQFTQGLVNFDEVEIAPLNDVYEKEHQNLGVTYSNLRFSEFHASIFSRKTRRLAKGLSRLYQKYEQSISLIYLSNRGFKTQYVYLEKEHLTPQSIDALVKKQVLTEALWQEISDLCQDLLY